MFYRLSLNLNNKRKDCAKIGPTQLQGTLVPKQVLEMGQLLVLELISPELWNMETTFT